MNRTDFTSSLTTIELFVYTMTIDLCVLVFYPVTLPNSLMSSRRILVESFGSSARIMPSENRNNLTFSFPICIAFISLSSTIALASTSSTTLNSCDESGHPYLVSNIEGNSFRPDLLQVFNVKEIEFLQLYICIC